MDIPAIIPVAPAVLSSPRSVSSASPAVQQQVALNLLKQANEFEGQLALQLLPNPPESTASRLQFIDTAVEIGQAIDIYA